MRVARRWKRCASSLVMPRWRNWTCACVQARLETRSKVAGSRYLSASASTRSRESATIRARWTRTVAPGARRTRRRRLKIGSRTVPTVFESGRRSSMALGISDRPAAPEKARRDRSRTAARRTARPAPSSPAPPRPAPRDRVDGGRASSASSRRDELGLDEEVRERGMRRVGCGRREDDLRVRRDLDLARARAEIRQRDPAASRRRLPSRRGPVGSSRSARRDDGSPRGLPSRPPRRSRASTPAG